MKRAKRLLLMSMLFATGTVVGAVGMSIQWHKVMSSFAASALAEMAIDVREIHSGNSEATFKRKTDAIPRLVQQLHSAHRRHLPEAQYNRTLWAVARFYEDVDTGIPLSIQAVMASIPPRPKTSCELRVTGGVTPETDKEAEPRRP